MPEEIAREIFKYFCARAERGCPKRRDRPAFRNRLATILLEREQTDEEVRAAFAPKRAEGVTDEDIAFWWNMHDLERRLICKVDEMNRILLFEKLVHGTGVAEPEAARMVAKRFPIYGDPEPSCPGNRGRPASAFRAEMARQPLHDGKNAVRSGKIPGGSGSVHFAECDPAQSVDARTNSDPGCRCIQLKPANPI